MAESPMVPTAINRRDSEKKLQVVWPDGVDKIVSYREVRLACHCAHCVDEWTGKLLLDPESVPMDVSIESMELKGNYAVKITWSDGHDTGLYSWTRLNSITRPDNA